MLRDIEMRELKVHENKANICDTESNKDDPVLNTMLMNQLENQNYSSNKANFPRTKQ